MKISRNFSLDHPQETYSCCMSLLKSKYVKKLSECLSTFERSLITLYNAATLSWGCQKTRPEELSRSLPSMWNINICLDIYHYMCILNCMHHFYIVGEWVLCRFFLVRTKNHQKNHQPRVFWDVICIKLLVWGTFTDQVSSDEWVTRFLPNPTNKIGQFCQSWQCHKFRPL